MNIDECRLHRAEGNDHFGNRSARTRFGSSESRPWYTVCAAAVTKGLKGSGVHGGVISRDCQSLAGISSFIAVQTSYHFLLSVSSSVSTKTLVGTRSVAPVSELDHAIWRALVLKPELPILLGTDPYAALQVAGWFSHP